MDERTLHRFRRALTTRRDALLAWFRNDHAHPDLVLEDDIEIGASDVICCIEEALECMHTGSFGKCVRCGEDVETERLALDFTTCVCLDHYSPDQLRALERDLELAAKVQRGLLPSVLPNLPGIDVAAHTEPARIVSGDYFDFFTDRLGAEGVAVADVMGKGVAASMLMANLQASLRILGSEIDALDALATRLNALFRYNMSVTGFISLVLVKVDAATGVLRYCNAGHHPPLLWKAGAGVVQELGPTGPALGLMHDPPYRSASVPIATGDVLVLYTDGLVEARDASGEEFGTERMADYLKAHAGEDAGAIVRGLRKAAVDCGVGAARDDVTLLALKVE